MAYLYTKGGDGGATGLLGGSRVSKADLQVACYGTVDEANSMLGLAKATSEDPELRAAIEGIQHRLFALAAELASDPKGAARLARPIGEEDVQTLEALIDRCTAITGKLDAFVVPGAGKASATLHVARTILRRAEREIIRLNEQKPVRPELLRYVNRLSDAAFALALLAAKGERQQETLQKVTNLVRQKMAEYGLGGEGYTLERLNQMARRAAQKAEEIAVPMVIAFVDEGANLKLLHRMEGALLASVDIAAGKAYTACALKMPTHELGALASPGGPLYGIEASNSGRLILFGGGFPLQTAGGVAGAIGVSGGSVEQDMAVARYALGME